MRFSAIRRLAPAVLLVGLAVPALAAAKRPSKQYTIEQFLATTAVNGVSFSADEKKILFSSDKTGIFNVYSIPVAGGEATPIRKQLLLVPAHPFHEAHRASSHPNP